MITRAVGDAALHQTHEWKLWWLEVKRLVGLFGPWLHFVGLAINRTCDHPGRLGVACELRSQTGLDLQCAAHAVADVRQMTEIGAGHRVDERIMKILLSA